MAFFNRPAKEEFTPAAARFTAKAASRGVRPFGAGRASIFGKAASGWSAGEMRFYRDMRAAVPVIDAAVSRLVRLSGGFSPKTGDEELDRELNLWGKRISVGNGGRGLDAFLDAYLDSLIVCGRAVGEIVPSEDGRGVAAVLCVDPVSVEPAGEDPLDFVLRGVDARGRHYDLTDSELVLFTPLSPEPGSPYGTSLLRSLGGVAEKLLLVYESVGACWERFGSPRYAVVLKENEKSALFGGEEDLRAVADEWKRVMSGVPGEVSDFVASGDIDVRVIGGESEALDPTAPARLFTEQIVAKMGIPPFLLGMSWSTSERMSTQQADLLTSEIDAFRRTVSPALERIYETQLELSGRPAKVEIEWTNVSLQDEVELAKAELYHAQAEVERSNIAE